MKWVQKNPAVVMIFAVAVVVIIALIVMTATRKKSDNDKNEEVGGSGKPEIEVLSMDKMLLPMDKTETYMIQEGYTITDLAKNVNFTLQWNNKGGLESVEKLIFKRFSPNNDTPVSTDTIDRDDTNPYFVPFTIDNSYVFKGSAISSNTNLIGVNKLQIMYVLKGETAEKVLFDSSVSFKNEEVEITDEDLKIIEITDIVQIVTYTPTVTSFSVLKASDDKNYYLYPGGGSLDVHSAMYNNMGGPIKFLPAQDTVGTTYKSSLFYIYFPDRKTYIGMGKPYVYQQCADGYEMGNARDSAAGKCVSTDGRKCVYPDSYDGYYCGHDGLRPLTFTPLTRRDIATSSRASALKFRITNSTVPNRYRFQTSDGLFLGESSNKIVLVDINDQSISNTLYKTIDIEVLQDEKK